MTKNCGKIHDAIETRKSRWKFSENFSQETREWMQQMELEKVALKFIFKPEEPTGRNWAN